MRRNLALVVPVLLLALAAAPVAAQSGDREPGGRLFLGFDREATLAERQWWEGQLEFAEGDGIDVQQIRLVAAVQAFRGIEFGGRVGFGSSDTRPGLPDGSGATDVDLWAKFDLGVRGGTRLAAGVLAVVPTGDDAAGLGNDAFGFGGFLSLRRAAGSTTWHADIGFRSQEDGQIFGVEQDGRTGGFLGVGVIVPWIRDLDVVVEGRFESERFRDRDEDARALAGIDWRAGNRGRFRAAAGVGFSDGAPDAQLIVGWASTF